MSQRKLAESIGLDDLGRSICIYESGRYPPRLKRLQKIAAVLGTTVADLYSENTATAQPKKSALSPEIEKIARFIARETARDPNFPKAAMAILRALRSIFRK